MMSSSDDLIQAWQAANPEEGLDERGLVAHLKARAHAFDRRIRYRDLRETGAGILIAAVFIWLAVFDRTVLDRAAHLWLAACGAWVVFFLRSYSSASRKPSPARTSIQYRQALLERYDVQIRLLKRARYWYILPFWAGLLFSAFASLESGGGWTRFAVIGGIATVVNAWIWWLNEVAGVSCLDQERREVLALIGCEPVEI